MSRVRLYGARCQSRAFIVLYRLSADMRETSSSDRLASGRTYKAQSLVMWEIYFTWTLRACG